MNIVYASSESYARHTALSMVSLFEANKKAKNLDVYVLSMGITDESRKRMQEMAESYHRKLWCIEIGNVREKFNFDVDARGFGVHVMGRLFMGSFLPETVDRVLYLDCDTVVVRPLKKLWGWELQGNVLAAVMEPTIYKSVKEKIGLKDTDAYVNAGVLLIDLKQWRDTGVEKRLLEFFKSKGGSLFGCDQDIINGALKGRICYLPPQYNFFPNYRYFSYGELVHYSETYLAVEKEEFLRAKRKPSIIHYAGDERPWVAGNLNHYKKAYEQALSLTPWAGAGKEKGKELYMLGYHLMDYLTFVCPWIRREISRRFGMKAVESRSRERNMGELQNKEGSAPKILVLLAAFQGSSYIEEQMDSILAQTVPNIQILISDDGSTDGTREIAQRYESEYSGKILCRHRVKEGKYSNQSKGVPDPAMNFFWLLSQADADYILLSDQDDKWLPNKVERLLERMMEIEKPDCPALVFSDMQVADDKLRPISSSFFEYEHCNPDRLSFAEILVENPITGGAMMMNRKLAEIAGKVPKACFMHDWWIGLCAACFGQISCVKEPLSLYRQHEHNVLGARKTGSLEDLKERRVRGEQVRENYRQMFCQARAFGKMYGERLSQPQRQVLKAFLKLPGKTPAGRLVSIVRNRFYKSSWIQTLAQCITIPKEGRP